VYDRLLHHYEAMMQEWSIKNGEPAGRNVVLGVDLGFGAEVRALQAAIAALEGKASTG
jgi:hypothetical protein